MLIRDFREELWNLTQKELSAKIKGVVAKLIQVEEAKKEPDHQEIANLRAPPTRPVTMSRLVNSRVRYY